MLFYVQVKRNHEGRISLAPLWDVDAVWPLRDYLGFAGDVKKHYKV